MINQKNELARNEIQPHIWHKKTTFATDQKVNSPPTSKHLFETKREQKDETIY